MRRSTNANHPCSRGARLGAALAILLGGCAGAARRDQVPRSPAADGHAPQSASVDRGAARSAPTDAAAFEPTKRIGPGDDGAGAGGPSPLQVFTDRVAFDACGGAPLVMDFDDLAAGQRLDGVAMDGVRFVPSTASLLVVRASDTSTPASGWSQRLADPGTYRLVATTGTNLLSPGGADLVPGPDLAREADSFSMRFDPPVCAVAFDFLSQSADGMSFADVTVLAADGRTLHAGRLGIADRTDGRADRRHTFAGPGADFWGIVADDRVIAEVRIDDRDNDASCPDANLGIDSLRFAPAPAEFAADVNDDGVVDSSDLECIQRAIRDVNRVDSLASVWRREDVDRDGIVDTADFALALDRYLARLSEPS